MKSYRGTLQATAMLLATLSLFGCGNPLDGGSCPSGSSCISVTSVVPASIEASLLGSENSFTVVTMVNESVPNSATPTNGRVTMSRYRVDFTGLNKSVSIPSIDGGGQTVGIVAGGSGSMSVLVMDAATLEYIREHYSVVGSGESLTLRGNITIWGNDFFGKTVKTGAEITIVVE